MNRRWRWQWPATAMAAVAATAACSSPAPERSQYTATSVSGAATRRAEALVLVDRTARDAADFDALVAPYFEHLGVPSTVVDVAAEPLPAAVGDYALVIVGHAGLFAAGHVDAAEVVALERAVAAGTGILTLQGDLWDGAHPRLPFVTQALGLTPATATLADAISFVAPQRVVTVAVEAGAGTRLVASASEAIAADDGRWDIAPGAGGAAIALAGIAEPRTANLPPLTLAADDLTPGRYDVVAELYAPPQGADLRYGFAIDGDSAHRQVVVSGGSGGSRGTVERHLGRVALDGRFRLQVGDATIVRGAPDRFGWSGVRLVPAPPDDERPHYIAAGHPHWERVPIGPSPVVAARPTDPTRVVAYAGEAPLLTVGRHGRGRIAHWSSYAWMRAGAPGPLGGLDDLLWRSLVWAARKPFVLQVLPPIVTMRMDDESGPLGWADAAIAAGFRPWIGVFLSNIDDGEARALARLAESGQATVSVHSFDDPTFFYFDHGGRRAWPPATMAANWRRAMDWHRQYGIPVSRYAVPHFYEIGAEALPLLQAAGVEFIATHMAPGTPYGSPWLRLGPFRRATRGVSTAPSPVYYADDLPAAPPGTPALFNCVTEIRDDAGYEWFPVADVAVSVDRGVRQLRRALASRAVATLFTHGYFVPPIPSASWAAILAGVRDGIAGAAPLQMTMEDACGFVRDQRRSAIAAAVEQPDGGVRVTLTGRTAAPTTVSLYFDDAAGVAEHRVPVPRFDGAVTIVAAAAVQSEPAGGGRR